MRTYSSLATGFLACSLTLLLLAGCTDEANPVGPTLAPTDADASPPREVQAAPPGLTEAPDLLSVGSFREGPPTDDGGPTTLVDYTFDQVAYLNNGNASSFALVPLDAGDALRGSSNIPLSDVDTEGDDVFTIPYEGDLDPADYARGFVDTGVLGSEDGNFSSENPANINLAAPVSNGGVTENPDLVGVTRDGDTVLFEFDEALTDDDLIQNTSGLRVFFASTSQNATIPDAGALSVQEESPTTLRAFFGDDLPEGKTLDQAVGGFVAQGTVQAAPGSQGANDGANAFDSFAPIEDTGAEVCAAAPETGDTGMMDGPTEAPDLLSVGNFRRGPFTSQFEPTTCVDFVFDQAAYLNGGTRSNFALVPLDGGDALSGTTNVEPASDEPGDVVVTIAFPGDLSPEDYARGFVDTGVVNSDASTINADAPANINQAEPIAPNTTTENPDLVSVKRDGTSFLFEFDEALTDDDLIQNTSGLRLYFPEAEQGSTIPFASASGVEEVDDRTLRAFYNTFPGDYEAEDAVGAYVVQGTVQAAPGSQGGNDGANAFDELDEIGTADADVCAPSPDVGGTGDMSGPTEAPDLLSVGNFREGPFTSQFEPTTCVDFTFDQVAYLNGGTRSNFALVPLDAGDALSGSTNEVPTETQDPAGDNIVTVIFPGELSAEDYARGFVDTGVVNSDASTINADAPANVAQAEAIAPNTTTENPDLVSVTPQADGSFVFEFDEALTDDDVVQNNSGLQIYFPSTSQSSTIPSAGAFRVEEESPSALRAFYQDLPEGFTVSDAVGALVQQGSVQAAPGSQGGNDGANAFDEVLLDALEPPTCDGLTATIYVYDGTIVGGDLDGEPYTPGSSDLPGTDGDDVIVGTDGPDRIDGFAGDDTICGLGGDDRFRGDGGNDRLFGGDGDDGIAGNDGDDALFGGDGDDTLRGNDGADLLDGGAGNDQATGDAGDDEIIGGAGSDRADGGAGTDTCDVEESQNCEG